MHNLGILQAGATPERGFGSPEYVANVHRTIANPTAPVAAFSPEYTPSSVAASPQYNGSMYTAASPTSPSYTKVTSYSSTAAGSPEYNRNAPSTPGYHPQLASPVSPSYSPSCRYVCAVYSLLGRLSMPLGGFFGGGICRSGGDSLADFRGPCCCCCCRNGGDGGGIDSNPTNSVLAPTCNAADAPCNAAVLIRTRVSVLAFLCCTFASLLLPRLPLFCCCFLCGDNVFFDVVAFFMIVAHCRFVDTRTLSFNNKTNVYIQNML